MATHDYNIANQGFPAFRADLNDALAAIVSNNSNATAPVTTFAHMVWVDTAANPSVLKIRNADNDAWITIGEIDQTGDKFNLKCANATILENLTLNAQGDLRFADSDSSHYVAFQAPATVSSNVTWTLPATDGTSGQALTTDGSGTLSWAAGSPEGSYSFRNRIINGDMRIDQRNAGASVTVNSSTATFPVDRFAGRGQTSAGVFTAQQSSTAPTGFTSSVICTVTTAASPPGATDAYLFRQNIEGLNVADLGWGTASAKTVTLSFWVRSSLTGTFGGALQNSAFNRFYPFSYSISVADTWEYKTVTIAGDTSGTWLTTNGIGITLSFSLGAGSSRVNTAGSWTASTTEGASGQVNLIATNGATWYITGVQLEVGSVATPFERIDYGRQLIQCQRYCYQAIGRDVGSTSSDWAAGGYSSTTTFSLCPINVPVTMRSASGQSLVLTSAASNYRALNGAGSGINATAVVLDTPSIRGPVIGVTVASGLTVGQGSAFYVDDSSHKAFIISEL